jgi:hypothetical protein
MGLPDWRWGSPSKRKSLSLQPPLHCRSGVDVVNLAAESATEYFGVYTVRLAVVARAPLAVVALEQNPVVAAALVDSVAVADYSNLLGSLDVSWSILNTCARSQTVEAERSGHSEIVANIVHVVHAGYVKRAVQERHVARSARVAAEVCRSEAKRASQATCSGRAIHYK